MKLLSEDLDIIKVLEEDEPGKWLEERQLKYLDIDNKKISIKGYAKEQIQDDPEIILRAFRLSGELMLDIEDSTLELMKEYMERLNNVPRNRRRDHFMGIITSNDAEKALNYVREADGLVFLFGDVTYRTASRRAIQDMNTVIDNINKARPEVEHRLTLLLRPFGKDGAVQILNYLIFDQEMGSMMVQAVKSVEKLYFLNTKIELKKYIKKVGIETYEFIDKIARQEKKIYDHANYKVDGRHYMLQEVAAYKEPIRVEELAIDADELINEGICNNQEHADEMLDMLLDYTIIMPKMNVKKDLMKRAKQIKRNPLLKYTRKIWWRR